MRAYPRVASCAPASLMGFPLAKERVMFSSRAWVMALGLSAALVGLSASAAAAQQLYWSQFQSDPRVGHVNLDGTASFTAAQSGQVFGMAVDPVAGHAYWIDNNARTIIRS